VRLRTAAAGWGIALASCAAAAVAGAQQLEVQVGAGPYYVDVPVEIRVVANGFDEDPTPESSAPEPATGSLEFLDVSPQVNSSIVIVNGRMSQSKQVRFVYRYQYQAERPGAVRLGPFRVTQGGDTRATRPVSLKIESVPASDRVAVELVLPEKRIYVGERVPVALRFRIEEDLRDRLEGYTLQVPLFDMTESFQFLDDPPADGTPLTIHTRTGDLELKGRAALVDQGGQRFLQVEVSRTAVPLRSGAVRIPASSILADEATRFRRDLFGGRVATHVRKLRAADRDRSLEVAALPRAGQPPSFAGAVGRGFQLDVAADRTVVQVGDPITLTLTLRGEGNLERLGLPSLDAPGLLPEDRFRVPTGDLPGVAEAGAKRFTAVVRVLDPRQQEIPALEYAWFDPERERYETTRSRPIALSVRPAEVVGADDVLSEPPPPAPAEAALAEAPEPAAPAPRELSTTGADLAIERSAARLVRDGRTSWGGPWLPAGLYGGSAAAVLLAVLDRRRRLDPEARTRRRRADGQLDAIRAAAGAPATQAAARIARALRALAAQQPGGHGRELDELLGECDARAYAPEGLRQDGPLDPRFHQRALEIAERLAERLRS
jgi:hypothetical protein